MKRVLVVAAVIRASDGRILIAKRPQAAHQGGLWEFPGGKVDAGESEPQALVRELEEELGIVATTFQPLIRIRHDYPDKSVELSVWTVDGFLQAEAVQGELGREGQRIAWVSPESLNDYEFPAANRPIIAAARLPVIWRISPDLKDADAVLAWCRQRLMAGVSVSETGDVPGREPSAESGSESVRASQGVEQAVSAGWLLRLPGWSDADYLAVARQVLALAQSQSIPLLLHGALERLQALPEAAGVHLPSAVAEALSAAGKRPIAANYILSVAAHDPQQLACAELLAADCAFLSPLLPTPSHPGQAGLGWSLWTQWVAAAKLPVYALGGLQADDLSQVRLAGGQGVAGISGF